MTKRLTLVDSQSKKTVTFDDSAQRRTVQVDHNAPLSTDHFWTGSAVTEESSVRVLESTGLVGRPSLKHPKLDSSSRCASDSMIETPLGGTKSIQRIETLKSMREINEEETLEDIQK